MLRAHHVGSCSINRAIAASIGRHGNSSQPGFERLRPQWHASPQQRSLYLSSTAPITFPNNREAIRIRLKDGKTIEQKFSPTPKANLDRLREALTELLQTPAQPAVTETPENEMHMPEISFGMTEWCLDPEG